MKKRTKIAVAATSVGVVGTLVYLAEKAAKSLTKKEEIESVDLKELKETRIRNNKGQTLTGYFTDHDYDTTMIIIHSLRTNGTDMISYYDYFKEKLPANYLLIDLAGYGKSDGEHITLDDSYEEDLIGWISYLKRLNQKNIILFGKQLGANVILNSLDRLKVIPEIKCIISDGASVSNEKMINDEINQMYPLLHNIIGFITKLILKYQYHIPFSHLNILDNLHNYDRPILFIQSRNDPMGKLKNVFKIYNAKKDEKELILLKDAAYLYEYEDENDPYYSTMLDFIKSKL